MQQRKRKRWVLLVPALVLSVSLPGAGAPQEREEGEEAGQSESQRKAVKGKGSATSPYSSS